MATSIWGSFTGSFFDTPNKENIKPRDSVDSLDDSIDMNEHFEGSKLVVQSSEDGDTSQNYKDGFDSVDFLQDFGEIQAAKPSDIQNLNRLSVISTTSTKNSSESMEILSGTGCTTSPESEGFSLTQSISTSSSGKQ